MSRIDLPARSRMLAWIGLLLVLIVAAALRLWRIDAIPPGFHFDESFEGLEAWRILTDPGYRPIFLAGNFGVPPLNAYANALMFGLFGLAGADAGPTAMRVTAAIFGVLGVLAVYLLAVELARLDGRTAVLSSAFPLLAAAFLAVMRWHIHFSRMGIEPVIVPLIWAASTWLLLRGWRTGGWINFFGCGFVLAAGMYSYQGAWVVPILTAVVAGILLIDRRTKIKKEAHTSSTDATGPILDLRSSLLRLLAAAGVATVLVLPLLGFFLRFPDLLLLRPAQLAVVGETGSPADNSVWQSVWATAKMFGPLGTPGDQDPRRNLPGAPALNVWLAIPFFLGLVIALARIRRTAYAITLIGLIGLLLPGFFSEYAPHFHRVLGAAAPVALLGGVGLDGLWSWQRLRRWHLHWLVIGLLIMGGITSARTYFMRWSALPDLYYAFDSGLWEMAQWIEAQPDDTTLFLTPRAVDHPTLAFALRDGPTHAAESGAEPSVNVVTFDGRHIFPLQEGKQAQSDHYLVVEHEDFRTRLLLPELFPDTVVAREFVDRAGNVYARLYTRPPETTAQRPPQTIIEVTLGDGIGLAGYDLLPEEAHAGDLLYLQIHWVADEEPLEDWTVFTHVTDLTSGEVVAGRDSRPGNGSLPTSRWQPGWRVLDEYQIVLPAEVPPGEYGLRAGLYQADGRQLPAEGSGIELGTFYVE